MCWPNDLLFAHVYMYTILKKPVLYFRNIYLYLWECVVFVSAELLVLDKL